MPADRLEALKQMLAMDPRNSLARYGLALEHANAGRLAAAIEEFQTLVADDPDYVAAYFHGGQTLEKAGRIDDARRMYDAGIEAATRKGDTHTRSELEAVRSMLPD